MTRPTPEIMDRLSQDALGLLEDTDLCVCPSCEEWIERADGTHSIPTDGYVDITHPMMTRTEWGTYAMRADLREAMWLVGAAYQDVPTVGNITPEPPRYVTIRRNPGRNEGWSAYQDDGASIPGTRTATKREAIEAARELGYQVR